MTTDFQQRGAFETVVWTSCMFPVFVIFYLGFLLLALKIQLKFRREILQQTSSDSNVYKLSKDKKKLTIDQLKTNLESLILHAFELEQNQAGTSSDPDMPLLQGRNVKHCFLENNIKTWYKGFVISSVPGFRNFYNIIYENDENVYTYKLLEDYANGDLEIIGIAVFNWASRHLSLRLKLLNSVTCII
jgi:hypothetical protein